MVMQITNTKVVTPFVSVVDIAVQVNHDNIVRNGTLNIVEVVLDENGNIISPPVASVTLDSVPAHISLVSVFVDGFRLVNATLDFGTTYQSYTVDGNVLTFVTPVTGRIEVYVDGPFYLNFPADNYVEMKNVQGAATKGRNPGDLFAAYFCEPVVLTKPVHGFARLTDDHKSILYVPERDYEGFDAFSYSIISDRGQLADPKCVYVKVGNPRPLKG